MLKPFLKKNNKSLLKENKLNELVILQDTKLVISNIKSEAKIILQNIKYPITYKGVKYSDGIDFYTAAVEPLY